MGVVKSQKVVITRLNFQRYTGVCTGPRTINVPNAIEFLLLTSGNPDHRF